MVVSGKNLLHDRKRCEIQGNTKIIQTSSSSGPFTEQHHCLLEPHVLSTRADVHPLIYSSILSLIKQALMCVALLQVSLHEGV